MEINLPYPISANRYWRIARNTLHLSAEARAYKQQAGWIAKKAGVRPLTGWMSVDITLLPRLTKEGKASRTRLDLDNALKVAIDALNGICWQDDRQIVAISATVGLPIHDGGLIIRVYEA